MSLRFIIDGYNVTNHPAFSKGRNSSDPRRRLIETIRHQRLCGSLKNTVIIVFDGYCKEFTGDSKREGNIDVVFSGDETADKKIKHYVEHASCPRDTVVISDDKEIWFFARSAGAKLMSVGEFLVPRALKRPAPQDEAAKPELNFSLMDKINKELRQIWLK